MIRVLNCIQYDHDWRLVLLGGLLSMVSCLAAVVILRKSQGGTVREGRRWVLVAGLSTGFGIWSTHFVAMLAYNSELIQGYSPSMTFLSLLLIAALTTAGFSVASRGGGGRPLLGGAIVGCGIGVVHYVGMAAIEIGGIMQWSTPYVLASLLLGIALAAPALKLTMQPRARLGQAFAGGALLSLAILTHHFTGMSALTIIPLPGTGTVSDTLMSRGALSVSIAAAAASLMALAIGAAILTSRADAARRRSEREFRLLIEGVTDCAIYMLDRAGHITSWNVGAEQLTGFSADEAIGRPFWQLNRSSESQPENGQARLDRAAQEAKTSSAGWYYRRDGSRFRAQMTLEQVLDADGRILGFAKIVRDITQQYEDQARLSKLAGDLDIALSNMHHGLCLFDADEKLVLANRRVAEMFGVTPECCPPGTPFVDTLRTVVEKDSGQTLTEEQLKQVHERHRSCIEQPDGGTLIAEFSESRVVSIVHRPMGDGAWVSTFEDITDRRRSEARIAHMATHDGLTGLPNREHLNDWLDSQLARADRKGWKVAVAAIDLNRFKEINDTHGHSGGDDVLRILAERFRATMQENELVARIGGDEFAAIRPFTDERDLADFMRRLESCFADRIGHERFSIVPASSIGIAIFPQDGGSREQLLTNADLAMYRAKASPGVQTCYFEPGMDEAHRSRRMLAQDLRQALAEGQFSLVYQVQQSIALDAVIGYEALIRWNHPARGSVPPAQFIPVAEENGTIIEIGKWVLQTACAEAASWAKPLRIAVNLSPVQLSDPTIVQTIAETLLNTGLAPSRLELEITESTIISDKAHGLHVLRQIKALGVSIAIDDFGTGYSSLDTLNSFPFDKIKIDRSFLSHSTANSQSLAIIRAVLALGRSLGMPVLAEGVETQVQLDLLRAEGCEQAQGYLLGRPQPMSVPEEMKAIA